MPVEEDYAYDESFISIESVPREHIEVEDLISVELMV